ncbi:MAG TPA: hydroxyacid dehydrogenase [Candidatus Omnitrophota bacterium]|jgi:D-3-phosphoglycerate dehydrogenase|nr:hydroxyacid dehydrogenase [Candidatus Omnitrophota bacterium]
MTQRRVLVSDPLSPRAVQMLRSAPGLLVEEVRGKKEEELLPLVATIDAWVVRGATKVTRRLLDAAPQLRWVARAGAGLDNIDTAAASERGIGVLNVPGANAVAVAELVFGLLLALFRRIPEADAAMRRGGFDKIQGRELRGKTLAIVGLGKIGGAVARRARAFEMEVIGFDPVVSSAQARELGVEAVTFEELFPRADILTLHAPMLPETKGMVGAAQIARMPRGSVLVNAARGALVDEAALVEALRSGALAGAALDVYAEEPPRGSPLLSMPNVVLTPHIGAATVEAQEAVGEEIVRMLLEKMGPGS